MILAVNWGGNRQGTALYPTIDLTVSILLPVNVNALTYETKLMFSSCS
jgi:hypothetical protein